MRSWSALSVASARSQTWRAACRYGARKQRTLRRLLVGLSGCAYRFLMLDCARSPCPVCCMAQEELDRQSPVVEDIDRQLNRVTSKLKSNNAKLKGLVLQVCERSGAAVLLVCSAAVAAKKKTRTLAHPPAADALASQLLHRHHPGVRGAGHHCIHRQHGAEEQGPLNAPVRTPGRGRSHGRLLGRCAWPCSPRAPASRASIHSSVQNPGPLYLCRLQSCTHAAW